MFAAVSISITGYFLHQALSISIICIDDGKITALKQHFFRLVIVLHGFVVIQVILRQIGENRSMEVNRANTMLYQTKGGNFHHHIVTACLCHLAEQLHQIINKWSGIISMQHLIANFILNGANQSDQIPVCC